jgi:menaquinol-cytochrome c reductase iron-sulfur subunit
MAKSYQLSRRDFFNITIISIGSVIAVTVGLPAVAYIVVPGLKVSKSEAWIPLGKVDQFPTGEPTLVTFTRTQVNGWEKTVLSYGVYVVKPSSGDLYVMSNVCTHLACRVNWRTDKKEFICPCHDGLFDIEGVVIGGPPPKPMSRYPTKIEDGTLYMQLVA